MTLHCVSDADIFFLVILVILISNSFIQRQIGLQKKYIGQYRTSSPRHSENTESQLNSKEERGKIPAACNTHAH